MNQAESLINFYQTSYKVCLGLAILFFILTVVLFFRLGIRKVIANRTGRAQRKSIERMREENAKTGHLRHAQKVAMGEYTPVSLSAPPREEQEHTKHESSSYASTPISPAKADTFVNQTGGENQRKKKSYHGKFVITKEVLLIHTDEWI